MVAVSRRRPLIDLDDYLWVGLLASLIVHLLLFGFAPQEDTARPEPGIISVSFVPPPSRVSQERTQIVSPPDNQKLLTDTNAERTLLSDRDASTEREQLRRGDMPEAGAVLGKGQPANPQPAQQSAQRAAPQNPAQPPVSKNARQPKREEVKSKQEPVNEPQERARASTKPLEHLALDDSTLLQKFALNASRPEKNNSAEKSVADPSSYQAFSRPQGSGAAFVGLRGVSDFLPNLPDGDITLLNTKADRFAVFVRRVATQVFAQMRSSGWESLRMGDVQRIGDYSSVRAILGKDGKLLRVQLEGTSGSPRFDEVLVDAVRQAARDSNPPVEARAADGNYHFIFKSKSWSRGAANARTGAPFERRWLLLATGLE